MNFLKRAFLSITRRKGKSLILFLVVFILGNVIAGSISIRQAASNVEKQIKAGLGAAATLEMDYDTFDKDAQEDETLYDNYPNLDLETIQAVGENDNVKYYDYSQSGYYGVEALKVYVPDTDDVAVERSDMGYVSTKGIHHAPILDIEEGVVELADGRVFENSEMDAGKYVCLISDKLAELNNLHVGDTMVVDITEFEYNDETGMPTDNKYKQEAAFEIIGLFKQSQAKQAELDEMNEEERWNQVWMDEQLLNTIYVPADVQREIDKAFYEGVMEKIPDIYTYEDENGEMITMDFEEMFIYYEPVYILKSPEAVEAFEEEVSPLLPKYYRVRSSADQYDTVKGPVESVDKMAGLIIIISVLASILIIALVVVLFLRDRRHELGIYLALGEKRGMVIGQILTEMLVISIVAITLSVFTGNVIAGAMSDSMISVEQETSNEEIIFYSSLEQYHQTISAEDVSEAYNVSFSFNYVIMFYIVGLGTILISSIVPLIYILRLNPKKIMM